MEITLPGLLLGALTIAIGVAFCFWGFRVFLILLPIWGFFAGFLVGANGVEYILGDGFLAAFELAAAPSRACAAALDAALEAIAEVGALGPSLSRG